jgi:hypothetical protein
VPRGVPRSHVGDHDDGQLAGWIVGGHGHRHNAGLCGGRQVRGRCQVFAGVHRSGGEQQRAVDGCCRCRGDPSRVRHGWCGACSTRSSSPCASTGSTGSGSPYCSRPCSTGSSSWSCCSARSPGSGTSCCSTKPCSTRSTRGTGGGTGCLHLQAGARTGRSCSPCPRSSCGTCCDSASSRSCAGARR